MSKHTPLPWKSAKLGTGFVVVNPSEPYATRTVCHADSGTRLENKANADLIVRAVNAHDDLLAACKDVTRMLEAAYRDLGMYAPDNPRFVAARAAIAKAT